MTPTERAWSNQHEDAVKAFTQLGLGKEYARNLIGQFPEQPEPGGLDKLVNMAYQAHGQSRIAARAKQPQGAPNGAVTIADQPTPGAPGPEAPAAGMSASIAGAAPPPRAPRGPRAPLTVGPAFGGEGSGAPQVAGAQPRGPRQSFMDWLRYGPGLEGSQTTKAPPPAPLTPAAAQTSPQRQPEAPAGGLERVAELPSQAKQVKGQLSPAAATFLAKLNLTPSETARARQLPGPGEAKALPAPAEKPRIRVRAAGQRIPPAPLGPATASQTPIASERAIGTQPSLRGERPTAPEMPAISTEEEYNKLEPGTLFRWTDGRLYRAHLNKP